MPTGVVGAGVALVTGVAAAPRRQSVRLLGGRAVEGAAAQRIADRRRVAEEAAAVWQRSAPAVAEVEVWRRSARPVAVAVAVVRQRSS